MTRTRHYALVESHYPNRPGMGRAADRFLEETGLIAVPPCLLGSPEHGLDPPPSLEGLALRIVKKSNADLPGYGHHGEMAHRRQVRYASELCPREICCAHVPVDTIRSSFIQIMTQM